MYLNAQSREEYTSLIIVPQRKIQGGKLRQFM